MTGRLHNKTQFLASGVMEISWLLCWANLIMGFVSAQLFPYLEALITFSFAVLLTFFSAGKRWRLIVKLMLQTYGMAIACFLLLHAFMFPAQPLFGRTWLIALFGMEGTLEDILLLASTIACTGVFWISGVKLARRPSNYWFVCRRFDFGILMFLNANTQLNFLLPGEQGISTDFG